MHKTILLGLAAAAALGACNSARGEDAGPVVERDYQVGNFDRLELAGAYDVTVRTGAAPSVHARGNEKLLEQLVVEVRGGALNIHPEKRNGFHWGSFQRGKVALTVTVPALRGAEIAGSGDIRIDRVAGDRFEGGIAGSGDLTVDRIEVQNLKLGIAGSGGARAGAGRAVNAQYEIAGSGGIDAKGVAAETAKVSIAGSGDVSAQASKTAEVSIMGSGDVEISGGAKCTISKAGSGNVRCS
jgi:hypothetical protein